jgi:hypothetical protein
MGKKDHGKAQKQKLTKKEKKQQAHLKLIQGGRSGSDSNTEDYHNKNDQKKAS